MMSTAQSNRIRLLEARLQLLKIENLALRKEVTALERRMLDIIALARAPLLVGPTSHEDVHKEEQRSGVG